MFCVERFHLEEMSLCDAWGPSASCVPVCVLETRHYAICVQLSRGIYCSALLLHKDKVTLFQPAFRLIFISYMSPLHAFICVSRKMRFGLFNSQGLDLSVAFDFYTGDTQIFLLGYLDSVL